MFVTNPVKTHLGNIRYNGDILHRFWFDNEKYNGACFLISYYQDKNLNSADIRLEGVKFYSVSFYLYDDNGNCMVNKLFETTDYFEANEKWEKIYKLLILRNYRITGSYKTFIDFCLG